MIAYKKKIIEKEKRKEGRKEAGLQYLKISRPSRRRHRIRDETHQAHRASHHGALFPVVIYIPNLLTA